MSLPAGVSSFELLFGKTFDFEGTPLRTDLVITPSHELVWEATGDRLVPIKVSKDAVEGEYGSVNLPHTDQAGFVDLKGNAITDWWYTVQSTDRRGRTAAAGPKTRKVQATSDQLTIDLDLIPTDGMVGPVGSVVLPVVTSVNGATGAVTVEAFSDAAVTAVAADSGSEFAAHLSATIVEEAGPVATEVATERVVNLTARAWSNKVAYLGDSKPTYGDGNASAGAYPDWVTAFSKAQAISTSVVSHPGWRADQLVATLTADIATIVASGARICVLDVGTNDALQATVPATFKAAFEAIVDGLLGAGIMPVVLTQAPATATNWGNISRVNWIISRSTWTRGLPLIDIFGALVDPATGQAKAANVVADGIHQTPVARVIVAKTIAAGLEAILPPAPFFVTVGPTMSNIPSPGFMVDTNGDGYADGITGTATSGTFAPSLVTDARGFNWQRLSLLTGFTGQASANSTTTLTSASHFTVGERYAFSCMFRNSVSGRLSVNATCYTTEFGLVEVISLTAKGNEAGTALFDADCVGYKEFTVPATTANIVFQVIVSGGIGTYDFALPSLVNLTRQAIT